MERIGTMGLPESGRLTAWNDLYAAHMSRVEFTPGDSHRFAAELSIGQLGPVKLARLSVDSCSIERSRRHLAQSPRLYSFLLQVRGSSVFAHCGREAQLSEGDFVLCDTGMPHYWRTLNPSTTIMVRVVPELLAEYLPTPEQFCGLRLGRSVGLAHTVAVMVQSLSEQVSLGSCPDYEARIARHLLEMISISYSLGFECQSSLPASAWKRRNDVIRYIEGHLHDPALTAGSVADGVYLSPRHLRTIFSGSGEKVSAYILRRRLEECAKLMRDPAWCNQSLAHIAFSRGFSSAAHFTRSFRAHFGVSPREYRVSETGR